MNEILALVPEGQATAVVQRSGRWLDASTWRDNRVPIAGDKVLIPTGMSVAIDDDISSAKMSWVRIQGKLNFSPNANSKVNFITTVVDLFGKLEIGTEQSPISPSNSVTFLIGHRTRDPQNDLKDLGMGILGLGPVSIFGSPVDAFAVPSKAPRAGESAIDFGAAAPKGWKAGARVVVGGAEDHGAQRDESGIPYGHEQRIIKAIQGGIVTLDKPLQFTHGDFWGYEGRSLPVAYLGQNITVTSEVSLDRTRALGLHNQSGYRPDFGHIMLMGGGMDASIGAGPSHIENAFFELLGRTTAFEPSTSPYFQDGKLAVGSDKNIIGRYAIHFHGLQPVPGQKATVVANSTLIHAGQFGMVNHGDYVDFLGDVVIDSQGSNFMTENGGEIGSYVKNLSIYTRSTPGMCDDCVNTPQLGVSGQQYGRSGNAYWLQGATVTAAGVDGLNGKQMSFRDNIAIGAPRGFVFFPTAIVDSSIDNYPVSALNSIFVANRNWAKYADANGIVGHNSIPFYVENLQSLFNREGITFSNVKLFDWRNTDASIVRNSLLLGNCGTALGLSYARDIQIRDTKVLGAPKTAFCGSAMHRNVPAGGRLELINVLIDGFNNGIPINARTNSYFENVYINIRYQPDAAINMEVGPTRHLHKNVTFGPDVTPGQGIRFGIPNSRDIGFPRLFGDFQFQFNGRELIPDVQLEEAVLFPTGSLSGSNLDFEGLSNAELACYGLLPGGRLFKGDDVEPAQNVQYGGYLKTGRSSWGFRPPLDRNALDVFGNSRPPVGFDFEPTQNAFPSHIAFDPGLFGGSIQRNGVQYPVVPRALRKGWGIVWSPNVEGLPRAAVVDYQTNGGAVEPPPLLGGRRCEPPRLAPQPFQAPVPTDDWPKVQGTVPPTPTVVPQPTAPPAVTPTGKRCLNSLKIELDVGREEESEGSREFYASAYVRGFDQYGRRFALKSRERSSLRVTWRVMPKGFAEIDRESSTSATILLDDNAPESMILRGTSKISSSRLCSTGKKKKVLAAFSEVPL